MDYEAVGRYTIGMKEAAKVWQAFNLKANGLAATINRGKIERFQELVTDFDGPKLIAELEEVAALHRKLVELCKEINVYAAQCGERLITIKGPPQPPQL